MAKKENTLEYFTEMKDKWKKIHDRLFMSVGLIPIFLIGLSSGYKYGVELPHEEVCNAQRAASNRIYNLEEDRMEKLSKIRSIQESDINSRLEVELGNASNKLYERTKEIYTKLIEEERVILRDIESSNQWKAYLDDERVKNSYKAILFSAGSSLPLLAATGFAWLKKRKYERKYWDKVEPPC